jgi:hypothetical protein
MRNNQDRIGNQVNSNSQQENLNVFNYVVPTYIVDLPSRGVYYPLGHPLHNKSTVEMREMTAKEEDILFNKSFIERGVVLDRLLSSIFIDKEIQPNTLLTIDKNALLLAARINGYGPEYGIKVECPRCSTEFETSVDLNDLLKIKEAELKQGMKFLENGLVRIELPQTKWIVDVKPLNGFDQEKLNKTLEGKKKHKLEENAIIESIKSFVVSINSVEDEEVIYDAILKMPAKDSKYLRSNYSDVFPNITTETKVNCIICSNETDMEVPFNINFFWSK